MTTVFLLELLFRFQESRVEAPRASSAAVYESRGEEPFILLGVGESSMFAEPYDSRLTFIDLVALGLRRSHPGRQIATRLVARKGAPLNSLLESAMYAIAERPSAVVVFAGHNDFHGAFPYRAACSPGGTGAYEFFRHSALFRFVHARVVRSGIEEAPVASDRAFFDRPIVCAPQWDDTLGRYRTAVTELARACREAGIASVFVFPAGNEVDVNPNRSVFDGTVDEQSRLEARFRAGRVALYRGDLDEASRSFDLASTIGPHFGELAFDRGRVALARGDVGAARARFEEAKDEDGFPWRALQIQRAALSDAAGRFKAGFVDGRAVLTDASPTHLLDGNVFHDVHHPTLLGYEALARAVIASLEDQRPAGLGTAIASAPPTVEEILDQVKFSSGDAFNLFATRVHWFDIFSSLSYDPSTRLFLLLDNLRATRALDEPLSLELFSEEFEAGMRRRLRDTVAGYGVDAHRLRRILADRQPLLSRYGYLLRADTEPVHIDGVPSMTRIGNGTIADGRCTDAAPLSIRGSVFRNGFCSNPPSDVVFRLERRFARFRVGLAIADGSASRAVAHCKVLGDDRLLEDVERVVAGDSAHAIDVDVTGIDELHLLCADGGDARIGVRVAWFSLHLVPGVDSTGAR